MEPRSRQDTDQIVVDVKVTTPLFHFGDFGVGVWEIGCRNSTDVGLGIGGDDGMDGLYPRRKGGTNGNISRWDGVILCETSI
jgi:hypothetical protein